VVCLSAFRAGIGFIALFGVAVLNGIVLIGTFNQLEKDGVKDIFKRVFDGTKKGCDLY
jgi:cobalt-zinc-cadmium resistance protein CzcA